MRQSMLCFCLFAMAFLGCSCAMHGAVHEWNGLVGAAGDPVRLDTTTKVGFRFLVVIPFVGDMSLGRMVEQATKNIRQQGGNYLRVIQSNSENYWFAFPPFTWIVTPVVNSLVVEYRPSEKAVLEGAAGFDRIDLRPVVSR